MWAHILTWCNMVWHEGHTLALVLDYNPYQVGGFGLQTSHIAQLVAQLCCIGRDPCLSLLVVRCTHFFLYHIGYVSSND